jgi:tripartite-type tricarboxylate transporter receptor subunit TctC
MKRNALNLFLIILAFCVFISPKEIHAAPYYEGKVIKLVVAFPPGGGYDRMARILEKYLPKYIPGKPTMIIENMPGASGMIGANYLYSIAKPDGLTFGSINRVTPSAQLLKLEGAKFDMLKYSWIGSAAVETSVLALRTDLPYKSFEDMKRAKNPIIIGATGPGDITYNFSTLIKQFLGLNLQIVSG